MPEQRNMPIGDLSIDLANYRSLPQPDEAHALEALIAADESSFWGVFDSLLEDGYLPTENIIVLATGTHHVVKEGNRRVAALKLMHGLISPIRTQLSSERASRVASLTDEWRRANSTAPCAVYPLAERDTVDRIVALAHGKGVTAGRLSWNAVARARHNRQENGKPEPALDLLEAYLREATNITGDEKVGWAAAYPLTVLEEAMKRLASQFGAGSAPDLAARYPGVLHRDALEAIMRDIGRGTAGFKHIRSTEFGDGYGLSAPEERARDGGGSTVSGHQAGTGRGTQAKGAAPARGGADEGSRKKKPAQPMNDPRSVKASLARLKPSGSNRHKVAALLREARKLNIRETPLAFCFVLRSMFELSAKAYCDDHAAAGGPSYLTKKGKDQDLKQVLEAVTKHLTNSMTDTQMVRELQGALTELQRHEGLLSVTSLNQLIHNPNYTTSQDHICAVFHNVFPLLRAMNS